MIDRPEERGGLRCVRRDPRAAAVRAPESRAAPLLAWVRVGDAMVHVSSLAHLAPADRPAARCPVCEDAVVLRLGAQRAHHAAHRAGSTCVLASGESAVHVNSKCHLAAELAAATSLRVRHRCAARSFDEGTGRRLRCAAVHDELLAEGWDEVRVELSLARTRPDVVLLRSGRSIAALEVLATHATGAAKAERLHALGVPWAEVRASSALHDDLGGWRGDRVLPVERSSALADWRCGLHARRAAAGVTGFRRWLGRHVDLFEPGGRHRRDLFYMEVELRGGRLVAARLLHALDDDVIARVGRMEEEQAARALHAAFVAWVRRRRAAGILVDSPRGWTPGAAARLETAAIRASVAEQPVRYRFDRDAAAWRRI